MVGNFPGFSGTANRKDAPTLEFTTPSGLCVSVPSKERREKMTDRQANWQRAIVWRHLAMVGIPDPTTNQATPISRSEIAKLFGVSRPLVSRWISELEGVLNFAAGLRENE